MALIHINTKTSNNKSDHNINIDETQQSGLLVHVFEGFSGKEVFLDDMVYFYRHYNQHGKHKRSHVRGNVSTLNTKYKKRHEGEPILHTCAIVDCFNKGEHHVICTSTKERKKKSYSMSDTMHQRFYGTQPSPNKLADKFYAKVAEMRKKFPEERDAEDATSIVATVAPVSLKRSRDDENLSIFAPVIQAKRPRLDTTFDFTAQSVVPTNIATAGTTQARLTDIEIAALLSFINPITTSDDTVSTPTPYNFDALLGIDTTSDTTVSTPYNFDIDLDALLGITNTTSDNTVPTPYKFDIDALRGLTNTTSDNTVPTPSTFAFDWSTPVEISAPVIPDALAFFKL